jgi:hypothetical protein
MSPCIYAIDHRHLKYRSYEYFGTDILTALKHPHKTIRKDEGKHDQPKDSDNNAAHQLTLMAY